MKMTPTVMIVEDEVLIALGLEDAFQEEGYEVAGSFATCADALACLAKRPPDLAVVDAMLKDGSCLELARELRRRDVPFLIYSGRNSFAEEPPEMDGILWVEKPAPAPSVVRAAAALLAR
jgi:DNA-binding response OmpR family regulator